MNTARANDAARAAKRVAGTTLRRTIAAAAAAAFLITVAFCFAPATGEASDLVPASSEPCGALQLGASALASPVVACGLPAAPVPVAPGFDHAADAPPPG